MAAEEPERCEAATCWLAACSAQRKHYSWLQKNKDGSVWEFSKWGRIKAVGVLIKNPFQCPVPKYSSAVHLTMTCDGVNTDLNQDYTSSREQENTLTGEPRSQKCERQSDKCRSFSFYEQWQSVRQQRSNKWQLNISILSTGKAPKWETERWMIKWWNRSTVPGIGPRPLTRSFLEWYFAPILACTYFPFAAWCTKTERKTSVPPTCPQVATEVTVTSDMPLPSVTAQ